MALAESVESVQEEFFGALLPLNLIGGSGTVQKVQLGEFHL